MMDSQEKALQQGQNEVIKEEEVSVQAVETPAEEPASQVETKEEQPQKVYASKEEILERVREIAHGDEAPQKESQPQGLHRRWGRSRTVSDRAR